jgi:hypothetical protein
MKVDFREKAENRQPKYSENSVKTLAKMGRKVIMSE